MSLRPRSILIKSKKYFRALKHAQFPRVLYVLVGSSWIIIIWFSVYFLNSHFLYCAYGVI